MTIKVKFLGFYQLEKREIQIQFDGTKFFHLIEELARKVKHFRDAVLDESGKVDNVVVILIGGEEQGSREKLGEIPLKDGETVTFLMMAGGG